MPEGRARNQNKSLFQEGEDSGSGLMTAVRQPALSASPSGHRAGTLTPWWNVLEPTAPDVGEERRPNTKVTRQPRLRETPCIHLQLLLLALPFPKAL